MIKKFFWISSYHPRLHSRWMTSYTRKSPADIFDRTAKHRQRDLTASKENFTTFSYLREEFGYRLSDRIFDVKRTFPVMIDMGCGQGHICKHLSDDTVQTVFYCDSSRHNLVRTYFPSPQN